MANGASLTFLGGLRRHVEPRGECLVLVPVHDHPAPDLWIPSDGAQRLLVFWPERLEDDDLAFQALRQARSRTRYGTIKTGVPSDTRS